MPRTSRSCSSARLSGSKSLRARDESRVHYEQFHNVFLYITERCQLRCGHCYMGDRLERGLVMDQERAAHILRACRRLGARYVTFIGGEPTLHPGLPELVNVAIAAGYAQVMIDTNGLNPEPILALSPKSVHCVSVSLDGASQVTHELVRGSGTFERTCNTAAALARAGFSVRISSTVFRFNLGEAQAVLSLAKELGASLVNFHTFSEEGNGVHREAWSLSPEEWVVFYEGLLSQPLPSGIAVWYPPTWAYPYRLDRFLAQGFRGCLGCSLDRLSVFPDGRCYVCSVLFDTPLHFATLSTDGFRLTGADNEFELFTHAAFRAARPELTGCPAEAIIRHHSGASGRLVSMCRCWKAEA